MHTQDDSGDLQLLIHRTNHPAHGFKQASHTLKGQEVRLHRNKNFMGCHQCVHGEVTQTGWAIENHHIPLPLRGRNLCGQLTVGIGRARQLHLCARQIHRAGKHIKTWANIFHQSVIETGGWIHQNVVRTRGGRIRIHAQMQAQVALGVQINQERASTSKGQTGTDVHHACGFANPAFLIQDGHDHWVGCHRCVHGGQPSGGMAGRGHQQPVPAPTLSL